MKFLFFHLAAILWLEERAKYQICMMIWPDPLEDRWRTVKEMPNFTLALDGGTRVTRLTHYR